jgi:hypothetical protein
LINFNIKPSYSSWVFLFIALGTPRCQEVLLDKFWSANGQLGDVSHRQAQLSSLACSFSIVKIWRVKGEDIAALLNVGSFLVADFVIEKS